MMNRKEFLTGCVAGGCTCAATTLIPESSLQAAETPKPDWRLDFVQKRYGAMLGILSRHMSEKELNASLVELGTFCASGGDAMLKDLHGDFDAFVKAMQKTSSGDTMTWDKQKNVITMTSPDRTDCFCPLNSVKHNTPASVCNCSLGWQTHTWQTFLQRKVRVEIKEAVLRGGKRCVFEIHVGEPV